MKISVPVPTVEHRTDRPEILEITEDNEGQDLLVISAASEEEGEVKNDMTASRCRQ